MNEALVFGVRLHDAVGLLLFLCLQSRFVCLDKSRGASKGSLAARGDQGRC
jgi:hypothetical protein